MSNAIEKGHALLRLRGAGATIESIRQMAGIYGEDTSLTPHLFVTQKFEPAKAITAFGGYAVFNGLMTDEQVYEQRDVFGEDYSSLDFSLSPEAFKSSVDALEAVAIDEADNEARKNRNLGITVGQDVTRLFKTAQRIKPTDMSRASLVTVANLTGVRDYINSLLEYDSVVETPVVGVLASV